MKERAKSTEKRPRYGVFEFFGTRPSQWLVSTQAVKRREGLVVDYSARKRKAEAARKKSGAGEAEAKLEGAGPAS